jgi:WD repeat-containing protein 48
LPIPADPVIIGTHGDYVRCLAPWYVRLVREYPDSIDPVHSREYNWVASGSFDRTIKLWDLTRSDQHEPLSTLSPPDAHAPKSSIYALAADPLGTTIASGSPERVIRLWDPRTGKRTGQ